MAELQIKLVNGELAGKTMQDINKQVRDAAVGLSKAKIGTDEYVKANEKLDKAKQLQADMKKQVEATSKASDTLKQSFGGILNQIPGFSQLSGIMGQAKSGVGGLTSGFGILKGAIAATGVGLLVIAFTTLVGWFKKTDEGATLLSGIMKGMGLVFDTVFGKLIDLAKGLGEFFTGKKSIKQGLVDLVDFIGNNLLNRLKSFIVIWKGITDFDLKTVTDGLIQFGSGIENGTDKIAEFGKAIGDAVNEGIEFEKELDRINDRALELSVINAESEKEVSQLLLQSKNVALTYEERIALLDKASEIELRNHQQQLVNARDLEALRKKEIDDNLKKNITNDDLNKAYADAQIARINLDKSSLDLQEKIYNRKTTLVEKETEEIKKYNEQKDKQLQKEVEFSDKRRAKDEENEKSHWNKKAAIAMQGAATNLANQILNNELATDEERKAYADKEKALQDHLDTVAANEDQAKQMLLGETIQLGSDLLNARIQSSKAD